MIIGHLVIANIVSIIAAVTSLSLGHSVLTAIAIYFIVGNLSLVIQVFGTALISKRPPSGAPHLRSAKAIQTDAI